MPWVGHSVDVGIVDMAFQMLRIWDGRGCQITQGVEHDYRHEGPETLDFQRENTPWIWAIPTAFHLLLDSSPPPVREGWFYLKAYMNTWSLSGRR